jgi:hypothetical protein
VQQQVADWLLARGANPTIFAAVALDRADLVRALVKRDPRLLSRQMSPFEHHRTPLHFAVLKNRPEMVELLLQLGADPTMKDARGDTPLSYASPKTDRRIAKVLVAAGADPVEQRSNRFESAVPILNVKDVSASIAYYVEKLGFLKEWDWGTPPTFGCVYRDQVRIFLCRGAQGGPGTWIDFRARRRRLGRSLYAQGQYNSTAWSLRTAYYVLFAVRLCVYTDDIPTGSSSD